MMTQKQALRQNLTKQAAVDTVYSHDEDTIVLTAQHVRELLANREPYREDLL